MVDLIGRTQVRAGALRAADEWSLAREHATTATARYLSETQIFTDFVDWTAAAPRARAASRASCLDRHITSAAY
jgi:hypothetical protein